MTDQNENPGWEWAVVEIFGHRRHAGRIREEERFGAKMLRIDVPTVKDGIATEWSTHFYGGSSIFSLTLTDEASVLRANKSYESPARVTFRSGHDVFEPGEIDGSDQDEETEAP